MRFVAAVSLLSTWSPLPPPFLTSFILFLHFLLHPLASQIPTHLTRTRFHFPATRSLHYLHYPRPSSTPPPTRAICSFSFIALPFFLVPILPLSLLSLTNSLLVSSAISPSSQPLSLLFTHFCFLELPLASHLIFLVFSPFFLFSSPSCVSSGK